jgi:hypothetical protein
MTTTADAAAPAAIECDDGFVVVDGDDVAAPAAIEDECDGFVVVLYRFFAENDDNFSSSFPVVFVFVLGASSSASSITFAFAFAVVKGDDGFGDVKEETFFFFFFSRCHCFCIIWRLSYFFGRSYCSSCRH